MNKIEKRIDEAIERLGKIPKAHQENRYRLLEEALACLFEIKYHMNWERNKSE